MATKGSSNELADDELEPLADETARQAQKVVAAYATDADECLTLLSMLGIGPNNRVLGRFRATGLRPTFADRLKASGIQLPPNIFEHVCEV